MGSAVLVEQLSRHFLAGRDGAVFVLKMYLDESGTHDDSPVIVVAGYIARPSHWGRWTTDWNRAKGRIRVFHSAQCNQFKGEFEGWSRDGRDNLVKGLIKVIADHEMVGVAVGMDLDAFVQAVSGYPKVVALFQEPYGACFQWLLMTTLIHLNRYEPGRPLALVHEVNDYKQIALNAFEWAKNWSKEAGLSNELVSLTFGDKATYPPLQSADVLAYEANRLLRNPEKHDRPSWKALNPSGNNLIVQHFEKKDMPDIVKHFHEVYDEALSSGRVAPQFAEELAARKPSRIFRRLHQPPQRGPRR